MRVVVLGGAGYLGSVLIKLLRHLGHEVKSIDTLIYGQDPNGVVHKDIRAVTETDLYGWDAVINLAALSSEWVCRRKPSVARDVNVFGAVRLAHCAKNAAIKHYIFASSASVYDGSMPEDVLAEDKPCPLGVYGGMKLEAEEGIAKVLVGSRTTCVTLRKGTLFGLGGTTRPRFDLAVQMMLRDVVLEHKIRVHSSPTPRWRPWLSVEDAACAYAWALEAESGVFNVLGENIEVSGIASIIQAFAPGVAIEKVSDMDTRSYRIDGSKIKKRGFVTRGTVSAFVADFLKAPPSADYMHDPRWYN